jgi:hypothetical protein
MTSFEETLAKVSPRLKAADACVRIGNVTAPHLLPMMMCALIVYLFGFTYPAVGVIALAVLNFGLSCFLCRYANRCDDGASAIWMKEFSAVAWTTACGEKIDILNVTPSGRAAIIEFEDGDTMSYPTSILLPVGKETALGLLPPRGSDQVDDTIETMLQTKWQTPGGDIGTIREFNFFALGDRRRTKLTLKLQSGKQATFFQTQLTELNRDH